ncbi:MULTISPECIES: hypothetical protein [unclassified Acetobacter]|uniref:hypothetical protein n=1 Tax=unclassified Acetobacter TaxID=2628570 RepID=UPI001237AD72|nr:MULTISPECIES: hypothetical protein [unclassified Acetobacter]MCG4255411.1 hypothetical protein [Acetobacter senegalensis]KAA8396039.1 hypothetical protein FKW19_09325 [Acetobacter sp. DmW_125128]KAA8396801.1 hypothetical protein FKW22_05495 [Acetobacter sp. DmW_125124]KAA8400232.1 hypothetical protein FKW20_02315 [Acetobacter sp. DmW_125127]KAA8402076.1 hypothetical protein FKW15_13300 [Acetobacter sp. DmW_125133]
MARNRNVTVRLSDDELERLQEVAPDGNVAKYIRDTVLRQSKSDLKLVNMDDKLVELGQDMRLVSDILADLERKVSGKPAAAGETGSQEPGGIPEELVGMVLETLLMMRSFCPPQERKMAQADVEQIGLPIWRKTNLRDR